MNKEIKMCKNEETYIVKNKDFIYSTYFAWLILNTPEEYKEVVAHNWYYDSHLYDNDVLVKILFTAEHEDGTELACVQEVKTKQIYIIDSSALELNELRLKKEDKEKTFLDRLYRQELTFLEEVAKGNGCANRECFVCILDKFPESNCKKLANDLLEKLK